MASWNPIHWEKCGWYLDCPLKRPPTFDIVLRDSIEPAFKGTAIDVPKKADKEATKKTRKTRLKKLVVELDDSSEDVLVQDTIKSLVVTGPFIFEC